MQTDGILLIAYGSLLSVTVRDREFTEQLSEFTLSGVLAHYIDYSLVLTCFVCCPVLPRAAEGYAHMLSFSQKSLLLTQIKPE